MYGSHNNWHQLIVANLKMFIGKADDKVVPIRKKNLYSSTSLSLLHIQSVVCVKWRNPIPPGSNPYEWTAIHRSVSGEAGRQLASDESSVGSEAGVFATTGNNPIRLSNHA